MINSNLLFSILSLIAILKILVNLFTIELSGLNGLNGGPIKLSSKELRFLFLIWLFCSRLMNIPLVNIPVNFILFMADNYPLEGMVNLSAPGKLIKKKYLLTTLKGLFPSHLAKGQKIL